MSASMTKTTEDLPESRCLESMLRLETEFNIQHHFLCKLSEVAVNLSVCLSDSDTMCYHPVKYSVYSWLLI